VVNQGGEFGLKKVTSKDKTPPSLRILHIINALSEHGGQMTMTALTEYLGLPKQTVHRLVASLNQEGYIERQGRILAPSHQLLDLANGLLQTRSNYSIRHSVLNEIAELTGETVNLVMPQHDGMRYVDRVDTNWGFRFLLPIGTHVPFHCTASGKTYMAFMRKDQRKNFVGRLELEAFTKNTHTTHDTLHQELDQIKKQGYAVDNEELYDDMLAIAVPVFDASQRYAAALAVHGPKTRFGEDHALGVKDRLVEAAEKISAIMFGG